MTIAAETEAHHAAAPRRALEKRQATARGRWLTLLETEVLGLLIDGKTLTYWLIFAVVGVLFLVLLRIVNSPVGRVLQAIRENDFRAEALGFRTVTYRTVSTVLAALFATVAGALLALWLRYVIGGMGTLYGAVIGSVLLVLSVYYSPRSPVGVLLPTESCRCTTPHGGGGEVEGENIAVSSGRSGGCWLT
jgi:ABC-type branched-subunit amino acid transport system permease subunit